MLHLLMIALAFLVMVFFIVKPLDIGLPGGRKFKLDYMFGSLAGVLIILLASVLSPAQAWSALAGRPGFEPYTIIIFFMALAYISVSLDSTGFFEFAALKIILRCDGSGRRLFFYFYFLASILTLMTTNDIVIITLTPIIFYFAKHAKINPIPYLVAEFFAANTWSMFLYIGNPTNIIAAMANNLPFLEYSYWMILPTIAAGAVTTVLLYVVFRHDIDRPFAVPKEINPDEFLKDRICAAVTLSIFLMTLICLVMSPMLNVELWMIAFMFAGLLFAYDSFMILREYYSNQVFYRTFKKYAYSKQLKVYQFRLHMIADKMPWKIVPFLVCAFIMVEALVASGVTDTLAAIMTALSPNIFAASISMGFISSFAANLINNQPMTVLFVKIMESNYYMLDGAARLVSVYALIIGSNLGANITPIGALAGIMWLKILKSKDTNVSYWDFVRIGLIIMPLVIFAACAVLALEFMYAGVP